MLITRKGVVSLSLYSLLVILFISVFVFSVSYYYLAKDSILEENKKLENLLSASSLRSELLVLNKS